MFSAVSFVDDNSGILLNPQRKISTSQNLTNLVKSHNPCGLASSNLGLRPCSWFPSWMFVHLPSSSGSGERSHKARPRPLGQTGRPGSHVHQHQQRPVHPQGGVHAGRQGRQLLWVPAQAVDPGGQDGGQVMQRLFLSSYLSLILIFAFFKAHTMCWWGTVLYYDGPKLRKHCKDHW